LFHLNGLHGERKRPKWGKGFPLQDLLTAEERGGKGKRGKEEKGKKGRSDCNKRGGEKGKNRGILNPNTAFPSFGGKVRERERAEKLLTHWRERKGRRKKCGAMNLSRCNLKASGGKGGEKALGKKDFCGGHPRRSKKKRERKEQYGCGWFWNNSEDGEGKKRGSGMGRCRVLRGRKKEEGRSLCYSKMGRKGGEEMLVLDET